MKIGNPADKPVPVGPTRATAHGAESESLAVSTSEGKGIDPSAKVKLSHAASSLLSGREAVTSEFDSERVSRIAQAIAEGKFKINADAIADKLIANAQELLGKSAH